MIKSAVDTDQEIADSIVQLKNIRFVNPQYDLRTTLTALTSPIYSRKVQTAKHHVEAHEHLKRMDYLPKMAEQLATF